MIIRYKIIKKKKLRIFGDKFVEKYAKKCKFVYNNNLGIIFKIGCNITWIS